MISDNDIQVIDRLGYNFIERVKEATGHENLKVAIIIVGEVQDISVGDENMAIGEAHIGGNRSAEYFMPIFKGLIESHERFKTNVDGETKH